MDDGRQPVGTEAAAMDAIWVVLGVAQLGVGIVWLVQVATDRRRPPELRRNFRTSSLTFPTVAGIVWLLLGLWWLGRGLLG